MKSCFITFVLILISIQAKAFFPAGFPTPIQSPTPVPKWGDANFRHSSMDINHLAMRRWLMALARDKNCTNTQQLTVAVQAASSTLKFEKYIGPYKEADGTVYKFMFPTDGLVSVKIKDAHLARISQ